MPRIIQPVVSPRGRVIVLSGATLWLIAAMLLSAIPDGAVADEGPARPVMTVITDFEEIDGAPGLLYQPRVFTDAAGLVYVIDRGAARVIRMVPGVEPVADVVFGAKGAGPGEFIRPRGLAVDADGNIFVADSQLGRISKFAADGSFLTSAPLPRAASVVVDSHGRVVAYPGRGKALLQRFDNGLTGEGEALLEKVDMKAHSVSSGVLMAMDEADRLYLLDQMGPTVVVYDADMQPVDEWAVDAPGLLETIEQRRDAALARVAESGGRLVSIAAIQAMALDPANGQLVFAYLVEPVQLPPSEAFTRVATYSLAGERTGVADREDRVHTNAFKPSGEFVEGDTERVRVWGPPTVPTASDN